jgi:molybdopterin/thiamine biosynthesis adenylyltransferase
MGTSHFEREALYRGEGYLEKLNSKKITVCGVGALGSNLVESLVRLGTSNITVIDKDRIEEKNLSCQTWSMSDMGVLKAKAMVTRAFRINGTEIKDQPKELTESNHASLLRGSSLIVDCFDNTASRQLLKDGVGVLGLPCIHAGLYEDYGEVVWNNFYKVPQDGGKDICDYPLARNIVMLTVTVLCEEILDYFLSENPRVKNWTITLKDLCIRERL